MSHDACSLWQYQNGVVEGGPLIKIKSLNAQQGNFFQEAKFSKCNQNIVTLLKDGTVDLWNIDQINGKHKTDL